MNVLKSVWAWLCGGVKSLAQEIGKVMLAKAKAIAQDKNLTELCLLAVEAAAKEGLTGDKAWVEARNRLTTALKATGRELGDCAIDTALQLTVAAWKAKQAGEEAE